MLLIIFKKHGWHETQRTKIIASQTAWLFIRCILLYYNLRWQAPVFVWSHWKRINGFKRFPTNSLVLVWVLRIIKSKIPEIKLGKLWQRSFFDRIIHDSESYTHFVNYINDNPKKWKNDPFNKWSVKINVNQSACRKKCGRKGRSYNHHDVIMK